MQFDYRHSLPSDEAHERLRALGDYLGNRHGIAVTWSGTRASFRGKYLVVHIEGELNLDEGVVHVSGKDPGMLWRKKATSYLKNKLAIYLDPSKPVDSLPRG